MQSCLTCVRPSKEDRSPLPRLVRQQLTTTFRCRPFHAEIEMTPHVLIAPVLVPGGGEVRRTMADRRQWRQGSTSEARASAKCGEKGRISIFGFSSLGSIAVQQRHNNQPRRPRRRARPGVVRHRRVPVERRGRLGVRRRAGNLAKHTTINRRSTQQSPSPDGRRC